MACGVFNLQRHGFGIIYVALRLFLNNERVSAVFQRHTFSYQQTCSLSSSFDFFSVFSWELSGLWWGSNAQYSSSDTRAKEISREKRKSFNQFDTDVGTASNSVRPPRGFKFCLDGKSRA